MLRRAGYALVLLASVQIMGGHWAVLQAVAWAGMIVDYSEKAGLAEGFQATFDGAHPCPLCETVAAGRQQEERQDKVPASLKAEKKADLFVRHASDLLVPPAARPRRWMAAAPAFAPLRSDAPSVPPPRAALA